VHIKEQKPVFQRFNALWTPTQLVLDSDGVERHRMEGFLPVDDFLAQLDLGLGKLAFQGGSYDEAEKRFLSVCESHGKSGAAPEACYWAGVSAYKARNDPAPLKATAQKLIKDYPNSEWARKASVWS
jgi:outer membrane protein assembly factor BamD (BamD/ComL family)